MNIKVAAFTESEKSSNTKYFLFNRSITAHDPNHITNSISLHCYGTWFVRIKYFLRVVLNIKVELHVWTKLTSYVYEQRSIHSDRLHVILSTCIDIYISKTATVITMMC